ncbi:hypothetical protein P175DRAFT_0445717 [Aspergillus ochraceoroseus IBT 24754]|uniref:Carboxylesterase type B domain-containing protein n=2 Tax=Aspergillus ochraceoroseus TaxID=138278 RepID=A0A2T5LMG5_9EURO|nr:uncharacterized protein P175DRAFT_0445717 [Aspergillus ochraceoroseus IBT 24754]KKK24410.1 hypothetical protein AOCH_004790 [Aspergillus ochraceoroseus]PTU17476.1 hypothetical protein P175DRAFT_0445717 [Aspergillus ochraceoroseus IBT 24754]
MNYLLLVAIYAVDSLALGLRPAKGFSPAYASLAGEKTSQALLHQSSYDLSSSGYLPLANERTSLTLLYQNNLNISDHENHVGTIVLDPMGQQDIRDACEELGESMISFSTIIDHKDDFRWMFSYLFYSNGQRGQEEHAHFYIQDGVLSVTKGVENFSHYTFPSHNLELPVLCTQTSTGSTADRGKNANRKLVRVRSEGNTYVGFRDQKSFRFLGMPYADPPARFTYPVLYSPKSQFIRATEYGPRCTQVDGGGEDCLYLNIQTPYIPKANSKEKLKAVLFWIHGGGFTGGSSADPLTDGGNLASREDIVVVSINYRLSTLGFLAVPGTDLRGNYGIADQVLALEWTIKNIAQFGGDPQRITIVGESAGAGSVRVLLGSPPALDKFQRAIAMSNLGGGLGLGLESSYATTYSSYLSISESYKTAGQDIFSGAGCNKGDIEQQVSCLRKIPASTLVNLPTVARYVVQDGNFVNTTELNLIEKDAGTAHVPVIFGNTADDGASLITYPSSEVQTQLEGLKEALGISTKYAQSIMDSGLFPLYDTGNITLDSFNVSQRIATNLQTRCTSQATVFAGASSGVFESAYYYQMHRTSGGYDPNNLGGPAATLDFPKGDPELPYFRLHGSDLPWVFGTLPSLRDALDLYSVQLISAYFAEFVRSGQPNPALDFLDARGYQRTKDAVDAFGRWERVSHSEGPIQLLDFPSDKGKFQDLDQCAFLGYPIIHYLV